MISQNSISIYKQLTGILDLVHRLVVGSVTGFAVDSGSRIGSDSGVGFASRIGSDSGLGSASRIGSDSGVASDSGVDSGLNLGVMNLFKVDAVNGSSVVAGFQRPLSLDFIW